MVYKYLIKMSFLLLLPYSHSQLYRKVKSLVTNSVIKKSKLSPIQCELHCQYHKECVSTAMKNEECLLIGIKNSSHPVLASINERVHLPRQKPYIYELGTCIFYEM